jgi:hypothetical protein
MYLSIPLDKQESKNLTRPSEYFSEIVHFNDTVLEDYNDLLD